MKRSMERSNWSLPGFPWTCPVSGLVSYILHIALGVHLFFQSGLKGLSFSHMPSGHLYPASLPGGISMTSSIVIPPGRIHYKLMLYSIRAIRIMQVYSSDIANSLTCFIQRARPIWYPGQTCFKFPCLPLERACFLNLAC